MITLGVCDYGIGITARFSTLRRRMDVTKWEIPEF